MFLGMTTAEPSSKSCSSPSKIAFPRSGLDSNKLVNVRMSFQADLFARCQRHEDELAVRAREQDFAKEVVVQ